MLPSSIRSPSCRPLFTYRLAIATTNRRLALIILSRESMHPWSMIIFARFFSSSAVSNGVRLICFRYSCNADGTVELAIPLFPFPCIQLVKPRIPTRWYRLTNARSGLFVTPIFDQIISTLNTLKTTLRTENNRQKTAKNTHPARYYASVQSNRMMRFRGAQARNNSPGCATRITRPPYTLSRPRLVHPSA